MKKVLAKLTFAAAALTLVSCNSNKFKIEGNITDAKDSVLYFENIGIEKTEVLDSVVLSNDGKFSFSADAKDAPDFYRLRIAGQVINLSVDSTETVSIKASYPTMAAGYTVEGSDNCTKIKELSAMQNELQTNIARIFNDPTLSYETSGDSANKVINNYKAEIRKKYIYREPMKAYAYFALFQTIGARPIFNPIYGKEDVKAFSAVATSWDMYYPHSLRGQNLHNITVEGIKNNRIVRNEIVQTQNEYEQANVSDPTELTMIDNNGNPRRLSDLKGKVVMLDFHLFGHEKSTQRIMMLRELYNKYHERGFEIYQIAFDGNAHFWKTQTAALPWISVRAEDDEQINELQTKYNVRVIPTYFIIDKNGVIQKRDIQIKDLNQTINEFL